MASRLQNLAPELVLNIVDAIFDEYAKDIASAHAQEWYDASYIGDTDPDDDSFASEDSSVSPQQRQIKQGVVWQDVASLAATCKTLYDLVTPILYRKDVEHNYASALILSAKSGCLASLLKSLQHGADPNGLDHTMPDIEWETHDTSIPRARPITPLHWAASKSHENVVAALLERGADVNHRIDIDGIAECLDLTCRSFSFSRINAGDLSTFGANALFHCLANCDPEMNDMDNTNLSKVFRIARRLIEAGSSMITHSGYGLHALHQMVHCYRIVDFLRFLLEDMKVDPNIRDGAGNTAAHHMSYGWLSIWWGNPKVDHAAALQSTCYLVKKGAILDTVDRMGQTAMSSAIAEHGTISALLFLGAGITCSEEDIVTLRSWVLPSLRTKWDNLLVDFQRDPVQNWEEVWTLLCRGQR